MSSSRFGEVAERFSCLLPVVALTCSACGPGASPTPGRGEADIEASSDAPRLSETSSCGNRSLEPGEACDDGNQNNGDGCNADCSQVEDGYRCDWLTATCTPVNGSFSAMMASICGDSIKHADEACDDGNQNNGDGCSADCSRVEPGFLCNGSGPGSCQAMMSTCGDGTLTPPESCDDGNTASGDGCSEQCSVENGWSCDAQGCEQRCIPAPAGAPADDSMGASSGSDAGATSESLVAIDAGEPSPAMTQNPDAGANSPDASSDSPPPTPAVPSSTATSLGATELPVCAPE